MEVRGLNERTQVQYLDDMNYVHLLGDKIKQVSLTFSVKPVALPVEAQALRLVHSRP